MKATKKRLRQLIRETVISLTEQPSVPGVMPIETVEDRYVQAVRVLGTRTVVREMIEQLVKKGVSDHDHNEILKVLDYESY